MKKSRRKPGQGINLGSDSYIRELAAAGNKDAIAILRASWDGTPLKNPVSFRRPGEPEFIDEDYGSPFPEVY